MSSTTVKESDISKLPPYQRRSFVPENANLGDAKEAQALYESLYTRAIGSVDELEKWILDRSELEAALSQFSGILYVRMTCQTDDAARANAYKDFIENVLPVIKPLNDRLNHKYLKERERFELPAKRYEVHDRAIKIDIKLFVDANVPLQTEVELLSQEYQTVCGAMTVEFQGKERTLPEMGKFLLEPDRALREAAWRATAERRFKDHAQLDEIFNKMLKLRHKIAKNAGCSNFTDYQFQSYHRFDYGPKECFDYHQTMEKEVVPFLKQILEKRKEEMKTDSLRPWDTAVDPLSRPPLKPFSEMHEFIDKTHQVFSKTDPELGKQFLEMRDLGLLDLGSRKGKAPGGYQNTMQESRKPFIFMNAVGTDGDVRTLLHEGGHAFHALACARDPLVDYRHAPMEFSEVASMAMELLAGDHLDVFYSPEDKKRSVREHLEGIVEILPWVATIDAFQHWIYANPEQTAAQRQRAWVEIYEGFGGDLIDWSGLENFRGYLWHRQLHVFEVPFYYIEYGIAQLGALQLWQQAKKDPKVALENYKRGLALGGSRPLPELYRAAGIKFDFSAAIIAPLMREVKEEWEKLV